jgi:hypothetical protein
MPASPTCAPAARRDARSAGGRQGRGPLTHSRGQSRAAGWSATCAGSTAEDSMARRWRPARSQRSRARPDHHQARAPTGTSSALSFPKHRCGRTGLLVHTSVRGAGPTREGANTNSCLRGVGGAQRATRGRSAAGAGARLDAAAEVERLQPGAAGRQRRHARLGHALAPAKVDAAQPPAGRRRRARPAGAAHSMTRSTHAPRLAAAAQPCFVDPARVPRYSPHASTAPFSGSRNLSMWPPTSAANFLPLHFCTSQRCWTACQGPKRRWQLFLWLFLRSGGAPRAGGERGEPRVAQLLAAARVEVRERRAARAERGERRVGQPLAGRQAQRVQPAAGGRHGGDAGIGDAAAAREVQDLAGRGTRVSGTGGPARRAERVQAGMARACTRKQHLPRGARLQLRARAAHQPRQRAVAQVGAAAQADAAQRAEQRRRAADHAVHLRSRRRRGSAKLFINP